MCCMLASWVRTVVIGVAEVVEHHCMRGPAVLGRKWEWAGLSGTVVVVARR